MLENKHKAKKADAKPSQAKLSQENRMDR